jgi:hypothetical protein
MDGKRHINIWIGVLAVLVLGTSIFSNSLPTLTTRAKSQYVCKKADSSSDTDRLPCEQNELEEESDFETKSYFFEHDASNFSHSLRLVATSPSSINSWSDRIASRVPIYLVTQSIII